MAEKDNHNKTKFALVVGLEIHVELKTESKMFCSCWNDSKETRPNYNICPVCMSHPGTLPVINKNAVEKVVEAGLALGCEIAKQSKFDRKNYFYPDLPKGYQISQYDMPLCKNGSFEVSNESESKKIRINRIHLEEDTGRLIHPQGKDYSLVDYNRAGVPLMELVTEPDINSAWQARKFAEELRLIFRYLGISDADMEKGQMRVEANISLRPISSEKLGIRTEIKNLNSFRAVEKAIEYEFKRQEEILSQGGAILQETRGWDAKKNKTLPQRKKEEANDYRYFPEPDLPCFSIEERLIGKIRSRIPELPQAKRERFKKEYGLLEKKIEVFVLNKKIGEYYEKVMSELRQWIKESDCKDVVEEGEYKKLADIASSYVSTELLGLLKGNLTFSITPENFAELVVLVYKKNISSKIAKMVLSEMLETGGDPSHIIKEKGLSQLTDETEIIKIIKQVILKNEDAAKDFKKGKINVLRFLIGQVMAVSKGKASPELVEKLLKEELGG